LLSDLREEKENSVSENFYLRQILSWVSAREPQLGMMIQQFKKEDGFGLGYKYSQADFKSVLGKALEWSKLTPEQHFPKTHNTQSFQADQPKDGVFDEPPPPPAPKPQPQPKLWPETFVCDYCHKQSHLEEFCLWRKWAERMEKSWRNKDQFH